MTQAARDKSLILSQRQAAIADITFLLPATFYADLNPAKRIRFMVEQWQRAIKVNHELEAKIDAIEEDRAKKAAREWLTAYGQSQWCSDPGCVSCIKDLKSLAALIERREAAAVESARPEIERRARIEMLKAGPPVEKLRLLATWIDLKFPNDADPEIQRDLRTWADNIEAKLTRLEKPVSDKAADK